MGKDNGFWKRSKGHFYVLSSVFMRKGLMKPKERMIWNFCSSCLCFLSATITSVVHCS